MSNWGVCEDIQWCWYSDNDILWPPWQFLKWPSFMHFSSHTSVFLEYIHKLGVNSYVFNDENFSYDIKMGVDGSNLPKETVLHNIRSRDTGIQYLRISRVYWLNILLFLVHFIFIITYILNIMCCGKCIRHILPL